MAEVHDLATAINRGMKQREIAGAIGREHGYLVNNLVYGVALGVIEKCRFALRTDKNEPVASCGEIDYALAIDPGETKEQKNDHPYHDGELTCNAVRGALITLGVYHNASWRSYFSYIWGE